MANREVRDWLLAFTFGATYFSSVVIVVGGAWAYIWGPATLLIPLLNVVVGAFLAFIVVGRRIARLSVEFDALTVPELLAKIHDSRSLQKVFGIVTSVGLTLYAATVISAASAMGAGGRYFHPSSPLGLSPPLSISTRAHGGFAFHGAGIPVI